MCKHPMNGRWCKKELAGSRIALFLCLFFVAVLTPACFDSKQSSLEETIKPSVQTTSVQPTSTIPVAGISQPKVLVRTATIPQVTIKASPSATLNTTPTLFPTSTPLSSLVWAGEIKIAAQLDSIDSGSIRWSPIENGFVVHNCWHALNNSLDQQSIYRATAPMFSLANITPLEYEWDCFFPQDMIWSIDGTQILYLGPFPEDHQLSDMGDYSVIWAMDLNGKNNYPINVDNASGQYLGLTGWLDNQTMVFNGYAGGGHHDVAIFDFMQRETISWAEVHIGGAYQPGVDYVGSNSGMSSDGYISAVAISKTKVQEETMFSGGPYILCVSQYCHGNPPDKPVLLNDNSLFEDWLPDTNKMLLLTWEEDKYLSADHNSLKADVVFPDETQLQLWDVDSHKVSILVSQGINGRFSDDGQFLAYLTINTQGEELSSMLNLLHIPNMEVDLSVHSAPPNIDYASEPNFSWSPDNDHILYLDDQSNWKILRISDSKVISITQEGGIRLSDPKWSVDGKYFSMSLWGGSAIVFQLFP